MLEALDKLKQILGLRIKHYRQQAGLTQLAMANALKVDHGTIWRWETGHVWPDFKQLKAAAALLGVEPEAFFETVSSLPPRPSPTVDALTKIIEKQEIRIHQLEAAVPPELPASLSTVRSEIISILSTFDDAQLRPILESLRDAAALAQLHDQGKKKGRIS